MVWSEYADEAFSGDLAYDSAGGSDGDGDADPGLHPEDWQDLHSHDLLNMWMSIQDYLETYGLKRMFLQGASFNTFCNFVYAHSIKS